jgi:hypothetical protein
MGPSKSTKGVHKNAWQPAGSTIAKRKRKGDSDSSHRSSSGSLGGGKHELRERPKSGKPDDAVKEVDGTTASVGEVCSSVGQYDEFQITSVVRTPLGTPGRWQVQYSSFFGPVFWICHLTSRNMSGPATYDCPQLIRCRCLKACELLC